MIIDIVKHSEIFQDLEKYNSLVSNYMAKFTFNSTYDLANNVLSPWFDPKNIRNLGLSRTYPHMCSVQYRPEYSLLIHCSNYLCLFLVAKLYDERKDIFIEDIGGGMGWLFFYLNKLGFKNFYLTENFSQLSRYSVENMFKTYNINCSINEKNTFPRVVNNVGVPDFILKEINPDLELVVCYTNRNLEGQAPKYFEEKGFKFLCKDSDDLAFAYCKNEKYAEFSNKLEQYV